MPPDQELVLIFGVLHLVALVFCALFFLMLLRSEPTTAWRPPPEEEEDGGGGGGSQVPHEPPALPPGGGSALPAKLRLRDHGRSADRRPGLPRRPEHPPHTAPAPARHR